MLNAAKLVTRNNGGYDVLKVVRSAPTFFLLNSLIFEKCGVKDGRIGRRIKRKYKQTNTKNYRKYLKIPDLNAKKKISFKKAP